MRRTLLRSPAFGRDLRRWLKALEAQRRIIFNDHTYELSRDDANTPEGFLKRRLKPLEGTQVDVICWSLLGGWADAPVYDSKIQPIYGDAHGGPPEYWPKATKNIKALIKGGRGRLQIVVDFAHPNNMELFASIRMNDCHDNFIPGGITLWKKEHPEFLVDRSGVPGNLEAHPLDAPRGDARMGVTRAGHVYVAFGNKLCSSREGGTHLDKSGPAGRCRWLWRDCR